MDEHTSYQKSICHKNIPIAINGQLLDDRIIGSDDKMLADGIIF
jgi:hypothetical protein